jgi:hypothetical protein
LNPSGTDYLVITPTVGFLDAGRRAGDLRGDGELARVGISGCVRSEERSDEWST